MEQLGPIKGAAHATAVALALILLGLCAAPARALEGSLTAGPFGGGQAQSLITAAAAPAGFEESTILSGLTLPTSVRLAPDGRIFVAEKGGLIKIFDGPGDTTPAILADLSTQVHDFWDRGLLGMTLDPNYATNGRVYVLYARNEEPGTTTMPRWPDGCPTPPGATADGCLITGTLSRLDSAGNETKLIAKDYCQQYPSHSVGSLVFGGDGMLYASAGDGASFNFADYGQDGSPLNPCGDPPGGVGGTQTPPTAEGGALRAQDVRTGTDPTTLDGSILRLDPNTGAAATGNPSSASLDLNTRRIIAHGLRNPFRITARPGTNEIWAGDVGWNDWEEIDRIQNPTAGVVNFGWPCYEGAGRQGGYDNLNLNICENLYSAGAGAVTSPYFTYNHGATVAPGDGCPTGSSSISGMAFYTTGPFPDAYDGALFFADYTRKCIWVMFRGSNGLPDVATRQVFVSAAANPVDVQIGPDGALYYADLDGGTIRRVRWPNSAPTARFTATPTSGAVPLTVSFNGSASSDPDPGDTIGYAWDLDDDGAFDDSTSATPSFTYTTPGQRTVRLRVSDSRGVTDTATTTITAGVPPTVTIATPVEGTTWQVGSTLTFSGSATDSQGNAIGASGLLWTLNLRHCARTDPNTCHTHQIQTFPGASGSFVAPDHEYPSYLELELTAIDSAGLKTTVVRRLDPRTVDLTFASSPPGVQLGVGSDSVTTPHTRTVIVGSTNSVSAPSPQSVGGINYAFTSWSDGGAQTHVITAPATSAAYTATFSSAGPSGLVAAYSFDEGAGTAVADSSGRGNNGTATNGPTWNASGRFGSALNFDGSNDFVNVPDSSSLDLTTGMTVEGWVNPSALGTVWRTVALKEQAGNLVYGLYANTSTSNPSGHAYIGGVDQNTRGTGAIPAGSWTHVATTYDGTTLRLFVNGTQVSSKAVAGSILASTGALKIGGNGIWAEWFAGRIDELRIYNRALSTAELQGDMTRPIGPAGPPPPPALDVSPGSLSFTATVGGGDPVAQSLSVINAGGGSLSFTAAGSTSWLQVSPASGSAPAPVSVQPRISGLAAGTYNGNVTITAAGAQGSPKTIPVTLRVDPALPPPTGGLVAAYGFDAGSGTVAADSSGAGNNGTISGAAWSTPGRFGSALSFDGVNDIVNVPDSSSLDLSTAATVEAWVNPATLGTTWRTVALKEQTNQLVYALYANTDTTRPSAHAFLGGTGEIETRGTAALPAATWTHLAMTYDGTAVRLYVNGTQVSSRAATGSIVASTGALRIGGNTVWSEWFSGRIDELRIYNRALTAAQVGADMNAPVTPGA